MECDWWLFNTRFTVPLLIIFVVEFIVIKTFIHNEYADLVKRANK